MRTPSGYRIDDPAAVVVRGLYSYIGVTTANGSALGITLVDANLANEPSYDGLPVKILSGPSAGQEKIIHNQGAGGVLTVPTAFTNPAGAVQQILAGTAFCILSVPGGGGGPTPAPEQDLCIYGIVDAIPGANQFTIASMAGLGAGKFDGATNPYSVFVFRDAGGAGAAPQGEILPVTAYDDATGTFTTNAFTAAVAVGDEILLLHPSLVSGMLNNQIFHEQADVAVNINAIAGGETDVLNLAAANTRYIVRHLRLKCANPGVNIVTVRLYELVNDGLAQVHDFIINNANFAEYFSLMDMFGLPYLAGDQLQVTVQASAGGPYAVTGQYSHAITT